MDLLIVVVLFGLALLVWPLWQKQQKAREWAMRYLRKQCEQDALQLLDETVELSSTQFRWNNGRPLALRTFVFEFSVDGGDRYQGSLQLAGYRVLAMQLETHKFQ